MVTNMVMKRKPSVPAQVSAAKFKATCLELMDAVERSGKSVVVTKRGRPVAQLSPVKKAHRSAFGAMRDQIQILGDIIEPIDVVWEANE